ncbi:CG10911, partial [Drosophila busckii]
MTKKCCYLLLVLLLGMGVQAKLDMSSIWKLKQQSQALGAEFSNNSPNCFGYYTPQLDGILQTYESNYNTCNLNYNQQITTENARWQYARDEIYVSSKNSCGAVNNCGSWKDYVDALECYAQAGNEQALIMYAISADATELVTEMSAAYQSIETVKTICVNNAERTYVENTAKTYEYLNACLNGTGPLPTVPT